MTIQTTIIPQKIDLSKTTDENYIDYSDVDGSDKKITFGQQAFNSLGLLSLRTSVLEANDSITGATNNFSDIFTTNTGLLNTVNITDTTSFYIDENKYYKNNSGTEGTFNQFNSTNSSKSGTVEFKSKVDNLYIKDFTFKCGCNPDCPSTFSIKINGVEVYSNVLHFYYNNYYTITVNQILNSGDYITFSFGNSSLFYKISSIPTNNLIEAQSSNCPSSTSNFNYISNYNPSIPANQTISLNYNKSKPKSLYFIPYSSDTGTNEVGDVTISLYTDTTLLGEFNPYQLYEGLTLASTPNKAVINQKDTSISKISKYVMLIQE